MIPGVVKHPLGFACYALALIFGLIAGFGPSDQRHWLVPTAIILAGLSILGGMLLAKIQLKAGPKQKPVSYGLSVVTQHTTGDRSPAISNTKGGISIDYRTKDQK